MKHEAQQTMTDQKQKSVSVSLLPLFRQFFSHPRTPTPFRFSRYQELRHVRLTSVSPHARLSQPHIILPLPTLDPLGVQYSSVKCCFPS